MPSFFSAVLSGFIALSNDAWWTLTGTSSNQLLDVKVSPFYAQIYAIGAPQTVPVAAILGGITRVLLIMATFALAFSSFQPNAWWKKITIWFSLSTIAEVFLSLTLLIHLTQTTLLATYGSTPPLLGTATLPISILGLDLTSYTNPALTATLALPFFLALASFILLGGGELYQALHNRQLELIRSDLTQGAREVHLSPPYQHVWLSSADQDLNPLNRDPDKQTDDQLAVSFDKVSKAIEPGGIFSIIIPAWATSLADRLLRLVPWAGFHTEKSDVIYRTPGQPENQLIFRKIIEKPKEEPTVELEIEGLPPPEPIMPETPPLVPTPGPQPIWAGQETSRQERAMVRSAASIIERRKEPVPYKELLNEVYMDLLDRNIEFDSAKQIETTLLKHTGRELAILEDEDETGTKVVKKWWLGDKGLASEGSEPVQFLRRISSKARSPLPKVHQLLEKWQKQHRRSGYRAKKNTDED